MPRVVGNDGMAGGMPGRKGPGVTPLYRWESGSTLTLGARREYHLRKLNN